MLGIGQRDPNEWLVERFGQTEDIEEVERLVRSSLEKEDFIGMVAQLRVPRSGEDSKTVFPARRVFLIFPTLYSRQFPAR